MEAILDNEQVRPGDETLFMHTIFTSDEEMMTFYLTLNRFVNMGTYFVQRPDVERLENLLVALGKFQYFADLLGSYHTLGVRQLIEGFWIVYSTATSFKQKPQMHRRKHWLSSEILIGYNERKRQYQITD